MLVSAVLRARRCTVRAAADPCRRRLSRLTVGRTPAFALERYFAEHEFTCKHALCSSDTEAISLAETVAAEL